MWFTKYNDTEMELDHVGCRQITLLQIARYQDE